MLKPRVGDLVRPASFNVFYQVTSIDGNLVTTTAGNGRWLLNTIVEVIRPARIKPRMTRKKAREWHRKQTCWELSRTEENYCASCTVDGGTRVIAYGKTEVSAVRALMKEVGVLP